MPKRWQCILVQLSCPQKAKSQLDCDTCGRVRRHLCKVTPLTTPNVLLYQVCRKKAANLKYRDFKVQFDSTFKALEEDYRCMVVVEYIPHPEDDALPGHYVTYVELPTRTWVRINSGDSGESVSYTTMDTTAVLATTKGNYFLFVKLGQASPYVTRHVDVEGEEEERLYDCMSPPPAFDLSSNEVEEAEVETPRQTIAVEGARTCMERLNVQVSGSPGLPSGPCASPTGEVHHGGGYFMGPDGSVYVSDDPTPSTEGYTTLQPTSPVFFSFMHEAQHTLTHHIQGRPTTPTRSSRIPLALSDLSDWALSVSVYCPSQLQSPFGLLRCHTHLSVLKIQ